MWDSYSESKRFCLSLITIIAFVCVVVTLTFMGWLSNHNTVEAKNKAYIACVQNHLPVECK